MAIHGYLGGVISATAPTVNNSGASGVFTLEEQLQYAGQNLWPGYQISRSVRLRASASAYFSRTFGTPTNANKWTWSGWVKRGVFGFQSLFGANDFNGGGNTSTHLFWMGSSSSEVFTFQWYNGGYVSSVATAAVYRDPSAWYHLVCAYDSTQATAANRVILYVNGVQQSVTSYSGGAATYPSQNTSSFIDTATGHRIGGYSSGYLDGYLTEINFIDGQALTPASFGATDTVTGVWNPIRYSGTYGTNGFYLNFSDPTSTTTIGYDYSGNSNNWTANNISVTAGTTYDSMVDVPIGYGSDTGVGGELRGNYATFNPLDFKGSNAPTLSFANLRINAVSTAAWRASASTIAFSSQKIYCEITLNGAGSASGGSRTFGVIAPTTNIGASGVGFASNTGWGIAATTGANDGAWTNGSKTTLTGISTANGTVYQIAVDGTVGSGSNKLWFGQNGTWFNSGVPSSGTSPIFSNLPSDMQFIAAILTDSGYDLDVNFGQRPFSYTAPSGFQALCTQNLPTPTISNGANYMAASLYTGTGASQTVSNAVNSISFQPDMVWIKSRSAATDNKLTDSVRGTTKALISNTTGAETTDTNGLTAFGSTGFTVGTDTVYNNSGATYVGWNWKGGGTAVTNNTGSVTSTVSANPTAGFSIIKYTTPSSGNCTVGHGLGIAPSFFIQKETGAATSWSCYHSALGATKAILLNSTGAAVTNSVYWNNTDPTSSVITIGSGFAGSYAEILYAFAPIAGYSAFGSYTGNGSTDGPFVYCGFRPRWVMVKDTANVTYWILCDSSRNTYNVVDGDLYPNANFAEAADPSFDFLANGFKVRKASGNFNNSGATTIYAAFAENPFNISRAR